MPWSAGDHVHAKTPAAHEPQPFVAPREFLAARAGDEDLPGRKRTDESPREEQRAAPGAGALREARHHVAVTPGRLGPVAPWKLEPCRNAIIPYAPKPATPINSIRTPPSAMDTPASSGSRLVLGSGIHSFRVPAVPLLRRDSVRLSSSLMQRSAVSPVSRLSVYSIRTSERFLIR